MVDTNYIRKVKNNAQKKTNSKKPLIILCVVVIVAVLAFLIYDEVQSSNYLNQLNEAISNTAALESAAPSATATCMRRVRTARAAAPRQDTPSICAAMTASPSRRAPSTRTGSELTSNFYIRPGDISTWTPPTTSGFAPTCRRA